MLKYFRIFLSFTGCYETMAKYLKFSVKKEQRLEEKIYKGSFFFGFEDDDRLEIVRIHEPI